MNSKRGNAQEEDGEAVNVQRVVNLQLTLQQLENLSDALYEVQDCGPPSGGWASDEVCELRDLIDALLEKVKAG